MQRKLLGIVAATVVIAFALSTDTFAFRLGRKPDSEKVSKKDNNFALSGTFSGTLAGEIKMGKTKVRVTPDTMIYAVGKGISSPDTYVSNRSVYVSGVRGNDGLVARMILIRPMESYHKTGMRDGNKDAMRIPSANNPDVGELAADSAR